MESPSAVSSPPPPPPGKGLLNSIWCIYIVSVISACNAEIVTFPLDLVKTRLQVQGEKATAMIQLPHRGMTYTTIGIIRDEGFFKLWKGIKAAFLRHSLYSGIRIVVYRDFRTRMMQMNKDPTKFTLVESVACGVVSGGIAQYVASPADLIKVQMQMEGRRQLLGLPPRVRGLWDALKKLYGQGGLTALWKGSTPNVYRAALVTVGDISAYDLSKRFILENTSLIDNHTTHILASFCAGFSAAVLGTPADVIKTRVMNQPFDEKGRGMVYKGPGDCLRKTVAEEGLGALYKGFIPVWFRLAPWALTFWLSYEQIMTSLGVSQF